jgi:hypothetical protein
MANVVTTNIAQTTSQPKPSTFKSREAPDDVTELAESALPFSSSSGSSANADDRFDTNGIPTRTSLPNGDPNMMMTSPPGSVEPPYTLQPSGPWEQITAFIDKQRVFPTKKPKAEFIRNTWVSPAEVMTNPSWRAVWEDREKQTLQKDATINGLFAASAAGLGIPVLGSLLSGGHPHLAAALAVMVAPFYFGAQALEKLNKLDTIKEKTGLPDDPDEAEGTLKLSPEQVQQLQQMLDQQQEQIELLQSGKRRR